MGLGEEGQGRALLVVVVRGPFHNYQLTETSRTA